MDPRHVVEWNNEPSVVQPPDHLLRTPPLPAKPKQSWAVYLSVGSAFDGGSPSLAVGLCWSDGPPWNPGVLALEGKTVSRPSGTPSGRWARSEAPRV